MDGAIHRLGGRSGHVACDGPIGTWGSERHASCLRRRVLPRWPALLLVVSAAVACSGSHDAGSEEASHEGHDGGGGAPGPVVDGTGALAPPCDEDNSIVGAVAGTVDRTLPNSVVQFERKLRWGCAHREWHESRQWDYIAADPKWAGRYAYAQRVGWRRAAVQEGAPGSGLHFLSMHRAMVVTLRDRFPEHADLFKGWATIPFASSDADPLPPSADGGAPGPFFVGMKQAITRLETDPASFPADDDLGRFLETRHRPTDAKPFEQTTDLTTGLHAFIHSRFDDSRSPIHMELFSRNVENETFFRFHGWIDRIWTQYRAAKGLSDDTDAAYTDAMTHACMHMGIANWDGRTCR